MATLALLLNGGPQAATSSVRAAVSVRDCYIGAAQAPGCPLPIAATRNGCQADACTYIDAAALCDASLCWDCAPHIALVELLMHAQGNRTVVTGTSRSTRPLRAARLYCTASLDLQAEPLKLGVTYWDPSGSGKSCVYSGKHDYGDDKNRFGKALWEMKKIIKESGEFKGAAAEDEKRLCLAVAMQVQM